MTLAAQQKAYASSILDGMARYLWVMAYADWATEGIPCGHCGIQLVREGSSDLSPHEQLNARDGDWMGADDESIECADGTQAHEPANTAKAGEDWDDASPETPRAAIKAAKDLAKLIELVEPPIADLFGLAMERDTGEAFSFGEDDGPSENQRKEREAKHELAYEFGSGLAAMSLGTGVSWFDDHKQFALELPSFECHFDGTDLHWSGKPAKGDVVSGDEDAKGPRIVTTYEVITPESAERGDVAERGFEDAIGMPMAPEGNRDKRTPADLAADWLIDTGGRAMEASGPDEDPRTWYTSYGTQNARTGATRNLSYHLKGFDPIDAVMAHMLYKGKIGKIDIINNRSYHEHWFVFAFGHGSSHLVLAFGDHFEDAFDEAGDWLEDNAPGLLANESIQEEYKRLEKAKLDEVGRDLYEDEIEKLQEEAEVDTTPIGGHGSYVNSDEWTIVAEDPTYEQLLEIGDIDPKTIKRLVENPSGTRCKRDHKALILDDAAWAKLEVVGIQQDEDDDGNPAPLELRDCTCGNTLSRPAPSGTTNKTHDPRRNGRVLSTSEIHDEIAKRGRRTFYTPAGALDMKAIRRVVGNDSANARAFARELGRGK